MQELERSVRSIELDGLLWGACKSDLSLLEDLSHPFLSFSSTSRSTCLYHQEITNYLCC